MRALVAVAMLALLPTSLFAQQTCESFTARTNDDRIVTTFDAGTEGPSIGDVRVGSRALLDSDGNEVGRSRWIISPLGFDDDEVPIHYEVRAYHIYDDGVLAYVVPNTQPRTHLLQGSPTMIPDTEGIIVGGTGVFANARGTITISRTKEPIELEFKYSIACD